MINWLEPDNVDDALLNWAAWYNSDEDLNAPTNPISLEYATAVERILDTLHWKEQKALKGSYLGVKCGFTEAALYTAKQAVEQGLRERKLIH